MYYRNILYAYNMNFNKPSKPKVFRIVVAGIISKDNKILLLQRPENEEFYPGTWELPGGTRDFNEKSADALVREVREETALNITAMNPISTFDYILEKHDQIVDTTQINFLAMMNNPLQEPRVSLEHKEIQWFTVEEIKVLEKITLETKLSIINAPLQNPVSNAKQ